MENRRDVGKSAKKAREVQDLIASFRHDHMHMEDGVLVEDTPPEPDIAGRDLGGIALAQFSDMGEFYDDYEGL